MVVLRLLEEIKNTGVKTTEARIEESEEKQKINSQQRAERETRQKDKGAR